MNKAQSRIASGINAEPLAVPASGAIRPSAAPAHRPAILLVDSDAHARATYRESLESLGYTIAEAGDGREALIEALVRPPAVVVIMKMTLPYVDGLALGQILRRDPVTSTIRMVIATATPRPSELQQAHRAGADLVLVSPTVDEMRTVVQRLLRNPAVDESGRTGKAAVPAAPETGSDRGRRTATKSFARCTTTTPPRAPLRLFCPSCDNVLVYERSHIGGVNAQQAEQWDYYTCASCGAFQYRHRTRKLTRMSA